MSHSAGGVVHLIVAGPLDQRTGGYLYDARMVEGLRARGREVVVLEIEGLWPEADADGRADLQERVRALPERALVLVDGLVGGAVPELLEPHAARLHLLPLVHHPLCDELRHMDAGDVDGRTDTSSGLEAARLEALEMRTLDAGAGVIVTSRFTADRVVEMGVDRSRVRIVEPGTERPAGASRPDTGATRATRRGMGEPMLLCVGSVVPRKGQAELVDALAALVDLPWQCRIVGSLARDVAYAAEVEATISRRGLGGRISLDGELDDAELGEAWEGTDIFVLASHYEGYGMAFTEALVRGLPVVGTTGGAIPSTVPPDVGRLVTPGDAEALATALRGLITDPAAREEAARRARTYARALPDWESQISAFATAIDELSGFETPAAGPGDTFSSDWLTLREPADHSARARTLVQRVADVGVEQDWRVVLDLGSGRGSNLRWLRPQLPWARQWVALDHDAGLLGEIREAWVDSEHALPGSELRTVEGDLAVEGIDEVGQADLVTASALLDLVTAEWVDALARACADRGAAALLALSWDGTASLTPTDPIAEEILDAVRAHQQGEKGMGVALGPAAPEVTAAAFRAVGMEVQTVSTPWRLSGSADGPLMLALLDGWVAAACEVAPERAGTFREWLERRTASVAAGEVSITVGHTDLLALPAPR